MRWKSFGFALKGLRHVFSSERNFRFHVAASAAVIAAGIYFHITDNEWLACIAAIGLVLVSETLNTAIEQLVNLVQPEQHQLAGRVKDIAAGAVLLSVICAMVIGVVVFGPHVWQLTGLTH